MEVVAGRTNQSEHLLLEWIYGFYPDEPLDFESTSVHRGRHVPFDCAKYPWWETKQDTGTPRYSGQRRTLLFFRILGTKDDYGIGWVDVEILNWLLLLLF